MSKLNQVRKGDRAEYITQGIFSAFGYSIQILRQEDYGIDFLCTLTEKDKIVSYPTKSYTVQLKTSHNNIVLQTTNPGRLKWLLENNLPFFVCYFDNVKNAVDFYSTSLMHKYIITKPVNVTKISLQFDISHGECTVHLGQHNKRNKIFRLTLGSPFLSISLNDVMDETVVEDRKFILNKVLDVEIQNIMYRNLGLPFMRWLHKYETNKKQMEIGWAHFADDGIIKSNQLLDKIGHIIMSLAYTYKVEGKTEEYQKIREFVLKLPFNKEYQSGLVNMNFRNSSGEPIN
jgi:hypothetical protein